jgi:hypothetical protein
MDLLLVHRLERHREIGLSARSLMTYFEQAYGMRELYTCKAC